jgi:hypothetical protein
VLRILRLHVAHGVCTIVGNHAHPKRESCRCLMQHYTQLHMYSKTGPQSTHQDLTTQRVIYFYSAHRSRHTLPKIYKDTRQAPQYTLSLQPLPVFRDTASGNIFHASPTNHHYPRTIHKASIHFLTEYISMHVRSRDVLSVGSRLSRVVL